MICSLQRLSKVVSFKALFLQPAPPGLQQHLFDVSLFGIEVPAAQCQRQTRMSLKKHQVPL